MNTNLQIERTKFLMRAFASSLIFSLILFLCAGRIKYFQGWLFLSANIIATVMNFLAIRNDEELMNERSKVGEGAKSWDKIILSLSGLVYIITIVVAGLDSGRFNWSPEVPIWFYLVGFASTIIGQFIFLKARKENKFFSTVVRIQTERNHTVCDSGIYKVVRHPGYSGMLLSLLALPFILGSCYCSIPVAIAIILLIIRTYLEDNTLKKELAGYNEYAEKTRKILIPWIW